MDGYAFTQLWSGESDRLDNLERFVDPLSRRCISQIGLAQGWACADVGAGRGSIANWLAMEVGNTEQIVAIDTVIDLLRNRLHPGIRVMQCDVTKDKLPQNEFDLIHMRFVLVHLSHQRAVLERIIRMLKPGGYLLVVESDYQSWHIPPEEATLNKIKTAYLTLTSAIGWNHHMGRELPSLLEKAGLTGVRGEAMSRYEPGGSVMTELVAGSIQALTPRLLSERLVSKREVELGLARLRDPMFKMEFVTTWGVWGQRVVSPGD